MLMKNPAINPMLTQWISWTRNRSGCDGRRPSGVAFTRTSLAHIDGGNYKTLCGRQIGPLAHEDTERDHCPICEARAKKLIADAKRTSKKRR
jgi:hypothetical protein